MRQMANRKDLDTVTVNYKAYDMQIGATFNGKSTQIPVARLSATVAV